MEALALVLATRHFKVSLFGGGGDEIIYDDHNLLTFLADFHCAKP